MKLSFLFFLIEHIHMHPRLKKVRRMVLYPIKAILVFCHKNNIIPATYWFDYIEHDLIYFKEGSIKCRLLVSPCIDSLSSEPLYF